MMKIKYIFLLFSLLVPSLLVQAEEVFLVKVSPEKVLLESKGVIFSISPKDTEDTIKIKNGSGIVPYYRYLGKEKSVFLKGSSLKETKVLVDEKDIKEIKVIFQEEPNFQLELNLSIKKDIPCLFVKASLKNISSAPQNIEFEWFANYQFQEYIAQDLNKYKMPEYIGDDYTQGMTMKSSWATIGLTRKDKWVYLLSNEMKNMGVISGTSTSFGLRPDRFIYWGGIQGMVEEGDGISYDFILVPVEKFKEFKKYFL